LCCLCICPGGSVHSSQIADACRCKPCHSRRAVHGDCDVGDWGYVYPFFDQYNAKATPILF
jgi:hypothetical protein